MSNKKEIAKIAREVRSIKAQLGKTSASKGDVYLEGTNNEKRTLWKKNVTPDQAEKLINKADDNEEFSNTSVELIFVPKDGGPEMMFTDKWEQV